MEEIRLLMNNINYTKQKICPSCGAPAVSEICPYCGVRTGLNTALADMEYPVLECKEASLSFWNVVFPLFFVFSFGFSGLFTVVLGAKFTTGVIFIGFFPLLISIVALSFVIRSLSRYMKVKQKGKVMLAKVYGYMDDNVLINGVPTQVVKLLVQTQMGPRFILYSLGKTIKPYGINDSIEVIAYENYFLILKNKESVKW